MSNFKVTVSPSALSMNNPLGDPLSIKLSQLVDQVKVLE